jgi:hypothetical protein
MVNQTFDFDYWSLYFKRFAIWSLFWGESIAFIFFHSIGFAPNSIASITVTSVEVVSLLFFGTTMVGIYLSVPSLLVYSRVKSSSAKRKLWVWILTILLVVLPIWFLWYIEKSEYSLPIIVVGLCFIPISVFIFKGYWTGARLKYAAFTIHPLILFLCLLFPGFPMQAMIMLGVVRHYDSILIARDLKADVLIDNKLTDCNVSYGMTNIDGHKMVKIKNATLLYRTSSDAYFYIYGTRQPKNKGCFVQSNLNPKNIYLLINSKNE